MPAQRTRASWPCLLLLSLSICSANSSAILLRFGGSSVPTALDIDIATASLSNLLDLASAQLGVPAHRLQLTLPTGRPLTDLDATLESLSLASGDELLVHDTTPSPTRMPTQHLVHLHYQQREYRMPVDIASAMLSDLVAVASAEFGLERDKITLSSNGMPLLGLGKTLAELHVTSGDVLAVAFDSPSPTSAPTATEIEVLSYLGRSRRFSLSPTSTVAELKSMVTSWSYGYPAAEQVLFFDGVELSDDRATISGLGVHSGDTVHLKRTPIACPSDLALSTCELLSHRDCTRGGRARLCTACASSQLCFPGQTTEVCEDSLLYAHCYPTLFMEEEPGGTRKRLRVLKKLSSMNVGDLRAVVADEAGRSIELAQIKFAGVLLRDDGASLADVGIEEFSTVVLLDDGFCVEDAYLYGSEVPCNSVDQQDSQGPPSWVKQTMSTNPKYRYDRCRGFFGAKTEFKNEFGQYVCAEADLNAGGPGVHVCSGLTTFAEAEAHCAKMSARLCTQEELRNSCAERTGCDYDYTWLWSSKPCRPSSEFYSGYSSSGHIVMPGDMRKWTTRFMPGVGLPQTPSATGHGMPSKVDCFGCTNGVCTRADGCSKFGVAGTVTAPWITDSPIFTRYLYLDAMADLFRPTGGGCQPDGDYGECCIPDDGPAKVFVRCCADHGPRVCAKCPEGRSAQMGVGKSLSACVCTTGSLDEQGNCGGAPTAPSITEPPTLFPSPGDRRIESSTPSNSPSAYPTRAPSATPSKVPSPAPTSYPVKLLTTSPTTPTSWPTSKFPTRAPTHAPSEQPTRGPTPAPTQSPTMSPSFAPTSGPTYEPTQSPTTSPSLAPTSGPTQEPTQSPTTSPTAAPTAGPTHEPTLHPTGTPTVSPSRSPSSSPSLSPTGMPTLESCQNGIQDFTETDVDCGGGSCPGCTIGERCIKNSDCDATGVCVSGECIATVSPTARPSSVPSTSPSAVPSASPTTAVPSIAPTSAPSVSPPTLSPTQTSVTVTSADGSKREIFFVGLNETSFGELFQWVAERFGLDANSAIEMSSERTAELFKLASADAQLNSTTLAERGVRHGEAFILVGTDDSLVEEVGRVPTTSGVELEGEDSFPWAIVGAAGGAALLALLGCCYCFFFIYGAGFGRRKEYCFSHKEDWMVYLEHPTRKHCCHKNCKIKGPLYGDGSKEGEHVSLKTGLGKRVIPPRPFSIKKVDQKNPVFGGKGAHRAGARAPPPLPPKHRSVGEKVLSQLRSTSKKGYGKMGGDDEDGYGNMGPVPGQRPRDHYTPYGYVSKHSNEDCLAEV